MRPDVVTRIPVLATSQAAFLARCLIRCRFEDRRHEPGAPAVMEVNPKGPPTEGEDGVPHRSPRRAMVGM